MVGHSRWLRASETAASRGRSRPCSYAREHGVPFLGICLGMQCAVIEFARNVLKMKDANSTEMEPSTKHPVIDLMEEQKGVTAKGGTMRLGGYPCQLRPDSKAAAAYGATDIVERHRHRYEFNNDYLERVRSRTACSPAGVNPETGLVEVVEAGEPSVVRRHAVSSRIQEYGAEVLRRCSWRSSDAALKYAGEKK